MQGLLLLLMITLGAVAAGCGSSDDAPPATSPTPTATVTVTRPLAQATAVPMPVTSDSTLPRWFFLVNGSSVPTPLVSFTPSVLTVNGAGPAGAPNPNSGTTVGLAPLNFVPDPSPQPMPMAETTPVPFTITGAPVWLALPGTQSGYFTLRSGASFTVDTTNNTVGSLMLGYGATEALLDLGYLPTWDAAIFLDQSTSPTGDNSCFQQWSYDTSTAQITNCNGGQLYGDASAVSVASATTAPGNQWYPLPNYHLVDVVQRANASPLFPAWTSGQQAAYDWISQQNPINATGPCVPVTVGVGSNQMTGQCFTGVRNEYQNADFQPESTNTQVQLLQYPSTTPDPYFAPADLMAVQQQLNLELTYVGEVQTLFANARTVLATVFWENTNTLTKVVADLGVSADAKPHAVAAEIAEGALYTVLSAVGGVDGGAVFGVAANVIQTVFETTLASQPSFVKEVGGTVGELAGNLNTQFNYMSDALTLAYNTTVYDWSRLSEVGPETQEAGYWGLFWPDELTGIVVPYMVNGYQITVMKALLPLTYNLHAVVGQKSASADPYGKDPEPPSYAQYAWPFGSDATTDAPTSTQTDWGHYYNQGFWESGSEILKYPDSTVMETDLLDLGADPFEIFNGINGWNGNGAGTIYYPNLSCMGVVVTLFNATPSDLWVKYTSEQGELSGPGEDYGAVFAQMFSFSYELGGLKGTVWSELRPYGYSTMFFAQDNVTPTNQTGSISVFDPAYSTTQPVAFFEEGQDGCTADSETNIHSGAFTAGGYDWMHLTGAGTWTRGLKTRGQSSGEPGGVWGVLIR